MATSTGFANIEKLTEDNYELWKVQMKSVLVFNDLWPYVDGTEAKPEQNAEEWTKKDSKALALINLSITHSQLNHVKKATTSKRAWDGLQLVFESRGPVRKAALYKQLLRIEKKPNESMSQYVTEFSRKAEQLEEAGISIPDELLSIMLLGSLPTEYENFSIAIESRDDIPSLENLKVKLIEEDARQTERHSKTSGDNKNKTFFIKRYSGDRDHSKQSSVNSSDLNHQKPPRKFNFRCFNCNKVGHKSRFCKIRSKHSESNNVNDVLIAIAGNTEHKKNPKFWCLDSGATRHMCNNDQSSVNLNNGEKSKVCVASKHVLNSPGVGDVNLKTKINSREINSVKVTNTMYVPELRNNLLSVSSVTDNGYTVVFNKDRATINRKDGSIALTATKRNRLYVIDEKEEYAAMTNQKSDKDLQMWHQRYGHLNFNDLKKMKNKAMVSGMDLASTTSELDCEICAKCEIHVQPFKQSNNRAKEILGLVHSDICGPIKTESLGGSK